MPTYDEPLKVVQIAGNVGRDPQRRNSDNGDWATFSVAVTKQYTDDDSGTQWVDVSVSKPNLVEAVLSQVSKGSKVVVEGAIKVVNKGGNTYHNMKGFRVGLVDYIGVGGGQSRPQQQAQAQPAAAEDDGWGF